MRKPLLHLLLGQQFHRRLQLIVQCLLDRAFAQKVSEETGNSAWHDASHPNSGGSYRRCHDLDHLVPIPLLGPELYAAGGSQAVVLGTTVGTIEGVPHATGSRLNDARETT